MCVGSEGGLKALVSGLLKFHGNDNKLNFKLYNILTEHKNSMICKLPLTCKSSIHDDDDDVTTVVDVEGTGLTEPSLLNN